MRIFLRLPSPCCLWTLEITSVNVSCLCRVCFMEWLARGSLDAANPVVVQERLSRVESTSSNRRERAVKMEDCEMTEPMFDSGVK
ncbi:hypothetical protein B0T09DRAFT_26579 [Sordaria sp. MPI-SDFR-AT-0083]|nr:hypothetical protein B0T09DRAFT_26579 [Sordaria sp. MPI-SDFR-AT-0083]